MLLEEALGWQQTRTDLECARESHWLPEPKVGSTSLPAVGISLPDGCSPCCGPSSHGVRRRDSHKFQVRPGPTRTPCLFRVMTGIWPYDRNRATACRAEVAASKSTKAAESMPNEPHLGQVYRYPPSTDDRIRSEAAPHSGQFAGSGSMILEKFRYCMDIQYRGMQAEKKPAAGCSRAGTESRGLNHM